MAARASASIVEAMDRTCAAHPHEGRVWIASVGSDHPRREIDMTSSPLTERTGILMHRPVDTGPAYWGPGDHYTFLVTGAESGGAYFPMEALVPPGGGPPPHIHRREDETFYLVEGEVEFHLGDDVVTAGPGDFVNVPRGTVHCFHNVGTAVARMVLTFAPAGMEHFFEETLEPAPNGARDVPDNVDEVAARYVAAAARHGLEFV